ncbi:UNVERIFIED_CONTAM: hypothetical protein RMT77_008346 [Armadillidium vulgare]
MNNITTGYGPRRLYFDGDVEKYELWEVKFLGHLRLQNLLHVINDSTADADGDDNAKVFAELVLVLDDRSLSLIIRDAKDDGKKALKILHDHYLGSSKPRVIALYTELTSLKLGSDEDVTDYILRAETAATFLKSAGENVSDSLLIAMVLKGLPSGYRTFSTVIIQKEKAMTFSEFKMALRSFEETVKSQQADIKPEENVMKIKDRKSYVKCFSCGKVGHKQFECSEKLNNHQITKQAYRGRGGYRQYYKRWCVNCNLQTHDTELCRKNNSAKIAKDESQSDESHSYAFIINEMSNVGHTPSNLLVDSGATSHILCDKSKFISFEENFDPSNHFIELADGSRMNNAAIGRGHAKVSICDINGKCHNILLKNALCVPSYRQDIFSVQAAAKNGVSINFTPKFAELVTPDGTVFNIKKTGGLYFLNNIGIKNMGSYSLQDWHKIMGHCNIQDVLKLENIVNGMNITSKENFDCSTCALGKMTQIRNREAEKYTTGILELVYCDLAGPIDPVARDGFKYVISFVDDYSGAIFVYLLKSKADTIAATEKFLADISPYGTVKRLRSVNGTEFTSGDFKSLLIKNRIKQEFSAPYSPHQNGKVERTWRTLFDMARCLLLEAKLPKKLWSYAVKTSAYIRNRCYHSKTGKTPHELITGRKTNLSNMHLFGSVCYAYSQEKKKLDAHSKQGIFVGYDNESPAYLVYFPEQKNIKKIRCVKFTEKFGQEEETHEFEYEYTRPRTQEDGSTEEENEEPNKEELSENEEQENRYPKRQRNKPKYLEDYDNDMDQNLINVNYSMDFCYRMISVPKSYEEAMASSDSHHWKKAMDEEIALVENDTFELSPLPRRSFSSWWKMGFCH